MVLRAPSQVKALGISPLFAAAVLVKTNGLVVAGVEGVGGGAEDVVRVVPLAAITPGWPGDWPQPAMAIIVQINSAPRALALTNLKLWRGPMEL
jgi:hypothetical protein